ncbi:Lys-63-specific deubiquitinase BRCC36 [Novymonas esmeraldas]|uniref:Lys-63-specific deubiquitinase BRCC36 n=1 Tax=Novymonas esmeraldas TaxID=1808958 RepID=A0AAW0EX94_9TRYP
MSTESVQRRESRSPLREVRVSDQVIQSCLRHAFTTEREEVMGVLLGRIELQSSPDPPTQSSHDGWTSVNRAESGADGVVSSGSGDGVVAAAAASSTAAAAVVGEREGKVAYVWGTHVSERSVQRSDRVEVSPESLASAAAAAERMAAETGVRTYVVGWYHSHPRIPVVPSAVDLSTQSRFQRHVESGWVGLIASVFNTEASNNRSHCAVHCFQAGPSCEHIEVSLRIVAQSALFPTPSPIAALPDTTPLLLRVLQQEVSNAVEATERATAHDAAASRAARGLADVQLFHIDRLIAEPTRKELALCTLPVLRAEVARLEAMLKASAMSPSPPPPR